MGLGVSTDGWLGCIRGSGYLQCCYIVMLFNKRADISVMLCVMILVLL